MPTMNQTQPCRRLLVFRYRCPPVARKWAFTPFRRRARGSWCFAYGLPNKPNIQSILPHGLSMPKVPQR